MSGPLPVAGPLDVDGLFNVKGLVALVTGGGTGESSSD
jgi:hypothetical protein